MQRRKHLLLCSTCWYITNTIFSTQYFKLFLFLHYRIIQVCNIIAQHCFYELWPLLNTKMLRFSFCFACIHLQLEHNILTLQTCIFSFLWQKKKKWWQEANQALLCPSVAEVHYQLDLTLFFRRGLTIFTTLWWHNCAHTSLQTV